MTWNKLIHYFVQWQSNFLSLNAGSDCKKKREWSFETFILGSGAHVTSFSIKELRIMTTSFVIRVVKTEYNLHFVWSLNVTLSILESAESLWS
jgi:hypothetical protein